MRITRSGEVAQDLKVLAQARPSRETLIPSGVLRFRG